MASEEPYVYVLKNEVEFGQQTITQLTFQPMRARHLRGYSPGSLSFDQIFDLTSKLTGVSKHIIDEMGISDTLEVTNIIGRFFGIGLKDGNEDIVTLPTT